MREDTKVNAGRRLARVEGQVRALRRMVDEDKYCIDIVRQVQAARAALASLESVIIDDHIQTCVHHAITEGGTSDREAKVAELVDVMRGVKK